MDELDPDRSPLAGLGPVAPRGRTDEQRVVLAVVPQAPMVAVALGRLGWRG